MTNEQFNLQIDRLRSVFGKKHYENQIILSTIWRAVANVDYSAFCRIVDHFITTFRKPPIPVDFIEAVKKEKKFCNEDEGKPYKIKCELCLDVGVVNVSSRQIAVDTLAICDCEIGKKQDWPLPSVYNLDKKTWTASPLEASMFKPKIKENMNEREFHRSVQEKVNWWKQKILNAKLFWNQM